MKLVYEVLAFLLNREISRMKAGGLSDARPLMAACRLLGQVEYHIKEGGE